MNCAFGNGAADYVLAFVNRLSELPNGVSGAFG